MQICKITNKLSLLLELGILQVVLLVQQIYLDQLLSLVLLLIR